MAILAAAFLIAFAVLVVWHARVDERMAWFEALRLVNVWALARLRRDWNGLPPADPPPAIDLAHHPYALDLDLFGRASLAQWLGPSATPAGSARLSAWLLDPADVPEIRLRQEAVAELAPVSDWREQLFARGVVATGERPVNLDRFFSWAEGPGLFKGREAAWHALIVALTLLIWLLLALQLLGVIDAPLWMIPVIPGLILSFATAYRVHGSFERAGAGQRALTRYAGLFEHALASPASGERLRHLHARLTAEGFSAPSCMRQLNRILGFAELRTGAAILHFPIQALTLWDFHVAFALDRWRARAGRRVRDWIAALGELDALSSFATVGFDNPAWCTPEFESAPLLDRFRARPSAPARRSPGHQRSRGWPARNRPRDHRVEHVREEHAIARDRPQRRAGPSRRSRMRRSSARCRPAICRPASGSRIRSSSGCPTSWRHSRV